ncbi:methyltransferase domain-containing protein [Baffinella frigidus]|nr:methyltransferase domain-containing protein [Cryptophyta sp. CCMP2293]|mmetsp:Transcript_43739/g.103997  ORF Transcript_43739/g.103997 Transcript_43739/m.103997 type:complete len:444 (-) Transcript_43739:42-1373(-)
MLEEGRDKQESEIRWIAASGGRRQQAQAAGLGVVVALVFFSKYGAGMWDAELGVQRFGRSIMGVSIYISVPSNEMVTIAIALLLCLQVAAGVAWSLNLFSVQSLLARAPPDSPTAKRRPLALAVLLVVGVLDAFCLARAIPVALEVAQRREDAAVVAARTLLLEADWLKKERAVDASWVATHATEAPKGREYADSWHDSYGFLEYPNDLWRAMKEIHKKQSKRQRLENSPGGPAFYQNNWEPSLSCPQEQRIGVMGDGGKWVCDPYKIAAAEECHILSIGSNNDWSFETAMHHLNPKCKICTLDHTITPINKPEFLTFLKRGISTDDEAPMITLPSAYEECGFGGKVVDVFKIDCEGCEWSVFRQFFAFPFRQLQIELHSMGPDFMANTFFVELAKHGYAIFHKEPNTFGCGGGCIEFSFLKLRPDTMYVPDTGEALTPIAPF